MRETSNARLTRLLELAIGSLTPPVGKRRIIVAISYGMICHFLFDWLQQGNRRQSEADLSDLDAKITWLEQEIDQYPSKTVSFFEIENGYDFGSQNV